MRFFTAFIFFLLCFISHAQGWWAEHMLPNSYLDQASCIFETAPNNYVGIGYKTDVNGVSRLCIVGLGNHGQLLWTKQYGNASFTYEDGLFRTQFGYKQGSHIYYVCKSIDSRNGTPILTGVFLKIDFNGDTLWQKLFYGTPGQATLQDVTGSVDGGFLISGFVSSATISGRPCLLIKTDADGNELWRKQISKTVNDGAPNIVDGKSILQDSASKKILIAGYQYKGNSSDWISYGSILILDSLGNTIEQRSYSGNNGGAWCDLIQTPDKKIVVVGINNVKSSVVKFDINIINSQPVWRLDIAPVYETGYGEGGFGCVQLLPDSSLIIGGVELSGSIYDMFTRLTKVNNNGQITWNNLYNYNARVASPRCLNLTSDNRIITAYSVYYENGPFIFVKYDSNGCDSTLAYCETTYTTGIEKYETEKVNVVVYPNPTNGIVYVNYISKEEKTAHVILSDAFGRAVYTGKVKVNEMLEIPLNSLSNGVYMLKLNNGKEMLYQTKVVYIK